MSFFGEMDRGLGAKGDFAQADVIPHEVAHHVQYVTGILQTANHTLRQKGQSQGPTPSPSTPSDRPISMQAHGLPIAISPRPSSQATWRKRSGQPVLWAMTVYKNALKALPCQIALPMAPAPNGWPGSKRAVKAGVYAAAIDLQPETFKRVRRLLRRARF